MCLVGAALLLALTRQSVGSEIWRVVGGESTLTFSTRLMERYALDVISDSAIRNRQAGEGNNVLRLEVTDFADLVLVSHDQTVDVIKGSIVHGNGLAIRGPFGGRHWTNLTLVPDHSDRSLSWLTAHDGQDLEAPGLLFRDTHVVLDPVRETLVIRCSAVYMSPDVSAALGWPELADKSIGSAIVTLRLTLAQPEGLVEDFGGSETYDGTVSSAGGTGPDIIVAKLQSLFNWGYVGDISAFSVGTTSCNLGDEEANWVSATNMHPVISQSMYRLKNNRFEQIGLHWLKHGFFALAQTECGVCTDPRTNGTTLGIGCSDPYSASLNGAQNILSRQSQANPHTGLFPFPPILENRSCSGCDKIERRLQVANTDLDPADNAGAQYFVQGFYVSSDDALAGNGNNNASYRRIEFIDPTSSICFFVPADGFCARVVDETVREKPAIRAWRDIDSSVVETDIQLTGNGLFILSAKTIDLGTGLFRYEYALYNLNSSCGGSAFEIPIPVGSRVSGFGFHDVDRHSGEVYDGTDWTVEVADRVIRWATTEDYATDPNANALRWGTLYNFWFEINAGPSSTSATIGLFEPSCPGLIRADTIGPWLEVIDCDNDGIPDTCELTCDAVGCVPPCGTSSDCNSNGIPDDCEPDCNGNGVAENCDLTSGTSNDCNGNAVPDGCEPDCDGDGIPDVCDDVVDTDQDGIDDCLDECPNTSPANSCVCPDDGCCFFPDNPLECLTVFTRDQCIAVGGTPECTESPCRNGCLVGDSNGDGRLNMSDVGALVACFSGATGQVGFVALRPQCQKWFDFDQDQDVDGVDYGLWLEAASSSR